MLKTDNISSEKIQELIPKVLEINDGNFEVKLQEQPAIFTTFSCVLADAAREVASVEGGLDTLIAQKAIDAKNSSTKKLTVADTQAIIDCDNEVITQRSLLADSQKKVSLLKGLLKGLEYQKDCLVQISANKRKEKEIYST
ncbi:hypothetical protein HOE37_06545 [Candidatus Woesearchaeota archaeon]|jgi:hypothetical protein|nr:hypothetical protein [Candidatus Woesearchaeota archaeon]